MFIKEMSNISDMFCMNLHEECLIKYLINPLDLWKTTELLKNNNFILEKEFDKINVLNKKCTVGKA